VFDADSARATDWGDEVPFLVMELVDGESVRQRLAKGPLPSSEVSTVGRCVGDALAYVHASGFIHRDVKPANILIDDKPSDPRFSVKLADFGIARLSGSTHLTSDGTAVGTANYLSPEQVTGSDITPASDVYSLGLVLLECLTGHTAFPGSGVEAALARLHRDPDIPRHVPAAWRHLITEMTWRDPAARLTAADVVMRLGSMSADGEGEDEDGSQTAELLMLVQPSTPDESPGHTAVLPALPIAAAAALPVRPRRRSWLGAAIAAVGAALVVLAIAAASGSSDTLNPPPPTSSTPAKNAVPITVHTTRAPPSKPATSHTPAPPPARPGHGHHHGNNDEG